MAAAQELIEQVRKELESVEARLRDPPYLQALDQGQIPKERLGVLVGEQHITIESDLRSLAVMLARSLNPRRRQLIFSLRTDDSPANHLPLSIV